MKPFVKKTSDVQWAQADRVRLRAQPPEFFRQDGHGRGPDPYEKMHFVEHMLQTAAAPKRYENDVYSVQIRNKPPFVQLTISRLDQQPCKCRKDFQQIKNELMGPECEAVELYPAESRLVDTRNEYHLWVLTPQSRFEIGYDERHMWGKPLG
jgi:hypothetical protein